MEVNQLKTTFFFLIVLATFLTMVSLFTPGWKHFDYGRMYKSVNASRENLPTAKYDECVIAFLILSLMFETLILVASMLHASKFVSSTATFYFETVFAFLIVIFLLAAIVKYSVDFRENNDMNKDEVNLIYILLNNSSSITNFNFSTTTGCDYGYWIAMLALILSTLATLIAITLTIVI